MYNIKTKTMGIFDSLNPVKMVMKPQLAKVAEMIEKADGIKPTDLYVSMTFHENGQPNTSYQSVNGNNTNFEVDETILQLLAEKKSLLPNFKKDTKLKSMSIMIHFGTVSMCIFANSFCGKESNFKI